MCFKNEIILFSRISISKIGVKMNFRIKTKTHVTDSKIGLLQKIDLNAILEIEQNNNKLH